MVRVHFNSGADGLPQSACGMVAVETVTDWSGVTCRLCAKRQPAPEPEEPPFVAGPAVPVVPAAGMSQGDLRAVHRSIAGEDGVERTRTVRAWLDAWAESVDAGVHRMSSPSSPVRFERGAMRDGATVGRVTIAMSTREDVLIVEQAIERAFKEDRSYGGPVLPAWAQRVAFDLRVCGKRVRRGRRGDAVVRVACDAEETAEYLRRRLGLDPDGVTARHVFLIVRRGIDAVTAMLDRRGLIPVAPSQPAQAWDPRRKLVTRGGQ
jgi:hypothetical protein